MIAQRLHSVGRIWLIALSLIALLTVLVGLAQAGPLPADEGTLAHVFQVSIAALVPATAVFLGTADWQQGWRGMRPLALAGLITAAAFSGLYYLEHVR